MACIPHPLPRAVGVPLNHVRRTGASCSYHAGSGDRKRRVVAKVDWHPGELYPRVGFTVTNLRRPAERVVAFHNRPGTADQWHKEGKTALKCMLLTCRRFRHHAVRRKLHAMAANPPYSTRNMAWPKGVDIDVWPT